MEGNHWKNVLKTEIYTLKLKVLERKLTSPRAGGGVASGRGLTSETVAAVVVMMLVWPLGRSIIPTPSISSAGDRSSSSAAAKPARPSEPHTHTYTQNMPQWVHFASHLDYNHLQTQKTDHSACSSSTTYWCKHADWRTLRFGYRVNRWTEFNLRKLALTELEMVVKVLTGSAIVPAGLWTPYGRSLSQPVIYYTRERTGQKEPRPSIRGRSSVKGVWRKQLSVRSTILNSLHPTLVWPTAARWLYGPDSTIKF